MTLYHGSALDVLPRIEQPKVCITDPVWPNSVFPGVSDPAALFASTAAILTCERLVVQLGCTSDPRFLAGVPARLSYFRTAWLRYARPSYRGRLLIGSDVAYVFGSAPPSRPGARVLSGEWVARSNQDRFKVPRRSKHRNDIDYAALPHPAPRRIEHVSWLVGLYSEGEVLDPFAGTGTTLLAAKNLGHKAVGIEIEERYCEYAVRRLAQESLLTEAI